MTNNNDDDDVDDDGGSISIEYTFQNTSHC